MRDEPGAGGQETKLARAQWGERSVGRRPSEAPGGSPSTSSIACFTGLVKGFACVLQQRGRCGPMPPHLAINV